MKVAVLGLGYIGLPVAALISSKGIPVLGVDTNKKIVSTISRGKIHFSEPELAGLVQRSVKNGFLKSSNKVETADVFIIAVPTPLKKKNKPDISYVESAVKMILPYLESGNMVVIESTVPVGFTHKISAFIFSKRPELKSRIHIAYCPERILPGNIMFELRQNNRIIGGIDSSSSNSASSFYKKFVKGKLFKTDSKTAEICKLAENAFRDVNIAFANELSLICDKAGLNVNEVIELAGKHPRVKILEPGPGVGGHCIAVDPWFLASVFPKQSLLIRQARKVNSKKRDWVIQKIRIAAGKFQKKTGRRPVIACMGLTYKPNVNDLRESPALSIYLNLKEQKFRLLAVDPNIHKDPKLKITTAYKAINDADIIVYLVAHKEFRPGKVNKDKIILDFCGVTRHS